MTAVITGGVSPVFVGRVAESAALAASYQHAVADGATFVVIAGEAGIGKSRLAAEFTAGLSPEARSVSGDCLELGGDSLPFAPFLAVLRRLGRELGVEALRAFLPTGELSLARWLPEIGKPPVDQDALLGRFRLFDEVLTLFERAAAQKPLVVVLEDLHWADPGTVELLAYLVRNVEQPGLLVVCTYRSTDLGPAHPLRPVIADITRRAGGRLIEPRALSRADVGRQLAGLLEREPDRALVDRIHDRSDGNPLFVEALAAAPTEATPSPLRDWLVLGMTRLPEASRSVLRAAAVAGPSFQHALLSPVSGLGDDELDRALRELLDQQLLVVRENGYAFRHLVFRDAVYSEVLPGERRRLHARCADAIQHDRSLAPEGHAAAELAMHWSAAADHERALDAAWEAAAVAGRSFAYEQQLQLLERVLAWWDQVPDPATRLGVSHATVLHSAAETCVATGAFDRGIAHATAALDQLDLVTDAAPAAQVLATRGLLNRRAGHGGDADLEAALRVMPGDAPPELRGQTMAMLAVSISRWDGDPHRAQRYADEALQLGREHGLCTVQATALIAAARIAGAAGDGDQALELFREAARVAEAGSDHYDLLTALLGEAYTRLGAGDLAQTAVVAAKGRSLAYRVGQARSRGADLSCVLAQVLWELGRWSEAREVIDEALADEPAAMTAAVLLNLLGEIALAEGDVAAAANSLTSLLTRQDGLGTLPLFTVPFRCRLALAQGDPDAADRILADALPNLLDPFGDPWAVLRAGVHVQQALLGRRDPARTKVAETRKGQLRELAGKLPADRPLQAAHQASLGAEIDGTDPLAWDLAVTAWRDRSHPYELAQALFGAAESWLATGDRPAATERLREAGSLTAELGAAHLAREIELLAGRGRIDLAPAEPTQPEPAGSFGLTARELDVLRLLTEGRTNSQIAASLFISPSTAGVHVSNILAKLGVSRRTEAAAVAHRAALFDGERLG
ncbi:AAA family ATPase [Kribbella sp. NPDC050124]|uniref:helix-turn-helix transcriptional regulator n=1 Tax=Kribbella sp. NPDC050124 TaxID=3364114 RepID=UPI0037A248F3